jgi:hypothetical protein
MHSDEAAAQAFDAYQSGYQQSAMMMITRTKKRQNKPPPIARKRQKKERETCDERKEKTEGEGVATAAAELSFY